jgi:hypothetical protein
MDWLYRMGVQHALEKLGFLGRLPPGTYETVQKVVRELPSKAKALKKIPPEELAKKKFLAGSLGPW